MRIFGFEITRQAEVARQKEQTLSAVNTGGGGWFGIVRESFGGAWQRNVEIDTPRQILAFSAVFACVTIIASDIAKLRLKLTYENEDGICEEIKKQSPFLPVLRKPNRYQTRIKFIEQWIVSKLLYGNVYVLKQRDQRGIVTALYILDAQRVTPLVAEDGTVYYRLVRDNLSQVEEPVTVPATEIIHDTMVSLWHPLVGVSPIYACGISATMGNRIQSNSTKFFDNMSRPSGMLSAPGTIDDEVAGRLKKHWEENFTGDNIGRLAVLGDGLKYEAMTIPAQEAQLIEQLKWTVEDVARCFVPGTEIITPQGPKPIEKIVVGDLVLTHRGRWRPVTQTIGNHYVGRVVHLQAKGLTAVTATANHPFFVQSAKPNRSHKIQPYGQPEWLLAENIVPAIRNIDRARSRKIFHNLVMPKLEGVAIGSIDLLEWAPKGADVSDQLLRASTNHRATYVKRKVATNYDLGWLCGLFAADGTATDHQVVFFLGEKETEITELLRTRLMTVFGANVTMKIERSMAICTVSNRVLSGFFTQFGSGAHNKALSPWCMSQSAEFSAGVLDGLVDGDGCINRGCTKLHTTSYVLAWQSRLLLWARNRNSCLYTQAARQIQINGNSYQAREIYSVEWREDPSQRGSMGVSDSYVFFSLDRAETSIYRGPVFNLEVEDDHSYTTVGGVAHNCFHVPLYKVGGPQPTYNNTEALNQGYYSDCLQSLIESAELCLDEGLSLPADYYTEFDLTGLLRMDTAARYDAKNKAVGAGWMSPNEARAGENMSPVEGGESPLIQMQNYSLSALSKRDAQENPFAPATPAAPAKADPKADDTEDNMDDENQPAEALAWYAQKELRRELFLIDG